jgi:hypothetical protein
MRLKKFLLLFIGSVLLAGILAVVLAPLLVAGGLRLWVARAARQEGLRIEFGKIETPLLRPVVVHSLQINSHPEAQFRVRVESSRVELALNLGAIFSRTRGRVLRSLTTDGITVDVRRNPQAASQRFAWRTLGDLLPDNFRLSGVELHVENGGTAVDLRDGTLSGAQIEAGVFSAGEITIVSPWFRKSFSHLRGATSWLDNRLSIGALTLTRGLDLDAVSIDLSQIGESQIGLELNVDAFGGKIRARVSSDDQGDKRTWDVAADVASEISLAQMSEALALTDRAGGSLHAGKFTFRGESTNLREATATVWAAVTGLTWRDRTADSIIIGASLYNRQVQVQQLFVKQRDNQLTLTGESALPQKLADWLNPDFRGDISASINDLGDFARLFGVSPSDFSGRIDVAGNVSARERKLAGQLTLSGNSLVVFRAPVESLKVSLSLKESRLEVANFELWRKNDSFRGQASMDLAGDRSYSASFTSSIAEAADYTTLLPEALQAFPFGGGLALDWTASGAGGAHSGTFHVRGHGLRPLGTFAIPFDAELEGDYSPGNIFFRQFNLSTPHAAFSAFVTVAKDYFQLQTLRLDLNGKPRLQGNIFLPISLSKLRTPGDWLAALSDDPNFDVDLSLDPMDLAELAAAITTQPKMSGQVSGSLEVHGTPASLQGRSTIHLHDFILGHGPRLSADLEAQTSLGTVEFKATARSRRSDPVNLEGAFPLKLEKVESGYAFNNDGPISATLNFPAIFLTRLPVSVSRQMFVDGILSGRLTISGSSRQPQLRGAANLINGRLLDGPSLSTALTFGGETATIDFMRVAQPNVRNVHAWAATRFTARGEIDFRDLTEIEVKVLPSEPVFQSTLLDPDDCVDGIELSLNGATKVRGQRIDELRLHGSLFAPNWTISLNEKHADDPLAMLLQEGTSRTFPLCHHLQPGGKTLLLRAAGLLFP